MDDCYRLQCERKNFSESKLRQGKSNLFDQPGQALLSKVSFSLEMLGMYLARTMSLVSGYAQSPTFLGALSSRDLYLCAYSYLYT